MRENDRCVTCDEVLDRDSPICRLCGEDNNAPADDLQYQLPASVQLDRLGAWSEAKHEILTKYLEAYTTILDKQRRAGAIHRIGYIDAFAGPGVALRAASDVQIPGSPMHALEVRPPFTEYHFIERDAEKAQILRELAAARGGNVRTYVGDHDSVLREQVLTRFHYNQRARAVCLLDPYGLTVRWSLIKAIADLQTVEIFFNFMVVGMNRNVLWRDPSRVNDTRRRLMNDVWGDESWRDAVYRREQDLFGLASETKVLGNAALVSAYRQRLKTVAGFKFVPEPVPMKNSLNATVYYLFFASPNQAGGKIVGEIFAKYRGALM